MVEEKKLVEETETNEKPVSNKLLHLIQHSIANRFSAQDLQNSIQQHKISIHENDESLTIDGAPSKIREIENLHSRLCQLLLNGANLNEILIVSPNLEEYRSAIYQIFNQAKIKAEKELSSSQKTTLYIPYNIIDSAQKDSHINNALTILFNIKKSKNILISNKNRNWKSNIGRFHRTNSKTSNSSVKMSIFYAWEPGNHPALSPPK